MSASLLKLKVAYGPVILAEPTYFSRTRNYTMDGSPVLDLFPGRTTLPPGCEPDLSYGPYYPLGFERLMQRILYLECKNSRNTVNWPGGAGTRTPGVRLTKRPLRMHRPQKPFYNPPKLSIPIRLVYKPLSDILPRPRVSYPKESVKAYLSYLENRSVKLLRRIHTVNLRRRTAVAVRDREIERRKSELAKRLSAYHLRFERQMEKYDIRMIRFMKAVERSKRPFFAKGPCYSKVVHTDNPYGVIKLSPVGDLSLGYSYDQQGIYPLGTPLPAKRLVTQVDVWNNNFTVASFTAGNNLADIAENMRVAVFRMIDKDMEAYDAHLTRKVYSKLKAQVVHIGNLLAERKQTFELFVSTFKTLAKLVTFKKAALKAVLQGLNSPSKIASNVLAFKFGVEPLVNDLFALAQFIDSGKDDLLVVVRTNSGYTKREPYEFHSGDFDFVGHIQLSYCVKLTASNSVVKTLSSFGLVNPAEILWEVTPWSFVVDWVLPIGAWISAQTASEGLDFLTGTRKVKLVGLFTFKGFPVSSIEGPVFPNQQKGIYGKFHGELIDRTVLTGLPDSSLVLSVKSPWSWSHGIESVALLILKIKSVRLSR